MTGPGRRRLRVAMYVANDASRDSRVLREADTLAAAGHDVILVARASVENPLPAEEQAPSGVRLVRISRDRRAIARWRSVQQRTGYPWRARGVLARGWLRDLRAGPSGWFRAGARLLATVVVLPWIAYRLVGYVLLGDRPPGLRRHGQLDYVMTWRRSVLSWADAAANVAPDADVHHGHDVEGLAAAVAAANRTGGLVVYDSHELYPESARHARQGPLARFWLRSLERRLARHAVALVTVNKSLEEILRKNLEFTRSVVVHNAPPRWTPPAKAPDLLRERLGLPPGALIALYHGGFSAHRGLEELAEAMLEPGLEAVHAVFLGYGKQRAMLDEMAVDPRFDGRLHVLDAVPPSELLPWVAPADVAVMCIQPSTLNHVLSTPNKLFEALAAGVPVVVSDFQEMREIVLGNPGGPLGAVCQPTDVADVANAIRQIVELPATEITALRGRCLRAAHEQWNWETESARLVALYEELAAGLSS
ncbi:MAG: glycosyltransferase [Chloroflexi bacterium]|nr:glycosyltransferase [Chloroflexota bacterium]